MAVRASSGGSSYFLLSALLAVIVLLAGCVQTPPDTTASPAPSSQGPTMTEPTPTAGDPTRPSSDPAGEQLTVRYDNGHGTVQTWTLNCDPPGGDHPDPAAACRALTDHGAALQPVPPDRVCTEQYGGPETARISGRWGGRAIDAKLSRTNGCEIARWDDLAGLLPRASA